MKNRYKQEVAYLSLCVDEYHEAGGGGLNNSDTAIITFSVHHPGVSTAQPVCWVSGVAGGEV